MKLLSLEGKTIIGEEILFNKWGDLIKEDPYYNKNLNSKKIDYTIKSELV